MDNNKTNTWNWIDEFKGDKVILIIAMLLLAASIITVFSSTSLLALGKGDSRESIMTSQTVMVGIGGLVVLFIYLFGNSKAYRFVGKYGFLASLAMLIILVFELDLGFVRASSINGAMRVIVVFGLQLHVYEFVKLFMILYASWALKTYKEGGFKLTKTIAALHPKLYGNAWLQFISSFHCSHFGSIIRDWWYRCKGHSGHGRCHGNCSGTSDACELFRSY